MDYISSIDSTTRSTLKATRNVEVAVGALAAEVAVIHKKASNIDEKTERMHKEVEEMQKKVDEVQQMLYTLYDQSRRQHLMQMAQTKIVKVRQEREKLYGNYDKVRKNVEGVLLATDTGIVRQNTIVTAAEELRLSTPKYWLSSCLVALSAWINNDRITASAALRESLNIDEEKTALFFALVCRRAGRMDACNQWMVRYLRSQNPEELDMRCVFMLDAYANGLLGNSSTSSVFDYMNEWVDILAQKDDFEQVQINNWSKVVNSCMKMPDDKFSAIDEFCTNKGIFNIKLQTAFLHENLFQYIDVIMSTPVNTGLIKENLDEILMELVTLFDDDERQKVYEELELEYIIKYQGDEKKAQSEAQLAKSRFEEVKDFTRILSDVAMGSQDGVAISPSTRKLSLAFCRDWIKSAYADVLAKNRVAANSPLCFTVDWYQFTSDNGQNEKMLLDDLKNEITKRANADKVNAASEYEDRKNTSKVFSIVSTVAAIIAFIWALGSGALIPAIIGLAATIIAGCNFIVFFKTAEEEYNAAVRSIDSRYKDMEQKMSKSVSRICADVYRMSKLIKEKNKAEKLTKRLLDELSPELYIASHEDDKKRSIRV